MRNKKILAGLLLATVTATGLSYSFADDTTSSSTGLNKLESRIGGKIGGKGGMNREMINLTDEEKTALESMTDEQKQTFFETKREESKAQREAQDTVIDKLLAGETLTADEETVRQELITQRAEQKAKKAEMEAQREQIQAIMDKKEAGETLTDEETKLLEQMGDHGMGVHSMMR